MIRLKLGSFFQLSKWDLSLMALREWLVGLNQSRLKLINTISFLTTIMGNKFLSFWLNIMANRAHRSKVNLSHLSWVMDRGCSSRIDSQSAWVERFGKNRVENCYGSIVWWNKKTQWSATELLYHWSAFNSKCFQSFIIFS